MLSVKVFVSLTKMDLTEFRSQDKEFIGLGGLATSDGVGWLNV